MDFVRNKQFISLDNINFWRFICLDNVLFCISKEYLIDCQVNEKSLAIYAGEETHERHPMLVREFR
ncbi:MAG: hypothetical protein IKR77_04180, partial [Bacteroidales bacterium]|nr:hypothetical protein [Bacteroidales bacterium]